MRQTRLNSQILDEVNGAKKESFFYATDDLDV
jgi:hypothetical protein